eukprot:2656533-Amphidinium_carterae.1
MQGCDVKVCHVKPTILPESGFFKFPDTSGGATYCHVKAKGLFWELNCSACRGLQSRRTELADKPL